MHGLEVLFPNTCADFDAAQTALDAGAFEDAWAVGRSLNPKAAMTWRLHAIHVSEQPAVA